MFRAFRSAALVAGFAALLAPGTAYAAPVAPSRNATAAVTITPPAQVRKLEDLNFGCLSVTTAGTAIVDPNTDALTTTGGVIRAGCLAYAAMFEAVSPVKNVVIIRIPRNAITLVRQGGTETMTVSNWTLSGESRRTVPVRETFTFNVGGTLNVGANQVEGLYVGNFEVEVQFP
jgi:hypothetical protein